MPDSDILAQAKYVAGEITPLPGGYEAWVSVRLFRDLVSLAETQAQQLAAIRALHWPSDDRHPFCDCYDGLGYPCPTVDILDGNQP